MAANNYFGFTHGGTQYSGQATAYTPAQGAYVHQAAGTATAYAAAPRAATTYDYGSAATGTASQYAYTTTPRQTAATYDTKAYFQPAAQTTYSTTEYQTLPFSAATQRAVSSNKSATAASASYVYQSAQPSATYLAPTTLSSTTGAATTKYAGYDAALYSAATNYYQQQQSKANQWTTGKTNTTGQRATTTTGQFNSGGFNRQNRPKPQPKQMQLHYCDVCKISCAGPQTYREHLEGQKHKKKEAAAKAELAQPASRGGQNQLQCKLCDVTCTGTDAYTAHIRGAKHQKVMKLHTILGKPIPSTEPVLISGAAAATATKAAAAVAAPAAKPAAVVTKTVPAANNAGIKKILSTPKITFVGSGQLKSTQLKVTDDVKNSSGVAVTVKAEAAEAAAEAETTVSLAALQEHESTPVGHEYIDEVKNELGKVVSFQCKLCDCKFNDPNAKEMHLKGRRHRLQYKKKVDPNLQVDVKPSIRARKIQEEKLRRQAQKEEYWKRRDEEERDFEAMQWQGGRGPMMGPQGYGPRGPMGPMDGGWNQGMMMRRPDSSDDRHVMAKHTSIYPNDEELQAVQNIVSTCEKALKLASDHIADIDAPKQMDTEKKSAVPVKKEADVKKEVEEDSTENKDKKDDKEDNATPRALKGVMRVGVLAKGLLLHGDLHVHLVVLCSEKPTRTLLVRVKENLPKQIESFTEEKYEVQLRVEDAAIIVTSDKEPKASCTITLTSPVMREDAPTSGETEKLVSAQDVLDRLKCLNALAALRHAKWFQARANGLQSCVIVIRILRDLCQRVPTWAPLNEWAMELLVEKCVGSGGRAMSPGDALRRVFECIASGVLLPGGPGLYDPCEKDPTDATVALTNQEREDITASAQHALRLIAFRQIHKVLGMDPLPMPKFTRGQRFNSRKRRRTTSQGELAEEGEPTNNADGKKDKKEENMETADVK